MAIIPPIGPTGIGSLGLDPSSPLGLRKAAGAPNAGTEFAGKVVGAMEHLDAMQGAADTLAEQAATGDLNAVQDYMIASTEAQLATQLTVAVRNRALEAFNEIMRMQV